MNHIKKSYPFVDLLKPETEPVLSVLLTLDDKALKNINLLDAFPILRDKLRGAQQQKKLLSSDTNDFFQLSNESVADVAIEHLLGSNYRAAINKTQQVQKSISEDDLLAETEEAIKRGISASEIADEEGTEGELGWWDIFAGKVGLVDKVEALRCSLQDWLKDDRTFQIDTEDDTYNQITERVNSEVDFIITGHTHLARAIEFDTGRFYFNSGTWIRLLRLTKEVLEESANEIFKKSAWHAFSSGQMSDLDAAKIPGENGNMEPLLYDRTHVVCISDNEGIVTGKLIHVTGGDNDDNELKLSPEFDTSQQG